jgi:aldose 1-epimerase
MMRAQPVNNLMSYLNLTHATQRLILNPEGGGIVAYFTAEKGERRDIVYGYDRAEKSGSMGDVLFPFPGRVEHSQYTFAGATYTLSDVAIKDGHAIHGFAKRSLWEVITVKEDQATLRYSIDASVYAERGFPYSLLLELTYTLSEEGMSCQALLRNTGPQPAPAGLGFHPYFTVGTRTVDAAHLQIAARKQVEFDAVLKPTGKLIPISESSLDFSQPTPVGSRVIDACFTDLEYSSGRCLTRLAAGNGRSVTVWQDAAFPYLQIYSADTISETHRRRALAIEPQTCTGFAFNVPQMGLLTLAPGQEFHGQWGICPA